MSNIIIIPNIENYNITFIDGSLYLTPKQVKMDEDDLYKKDISASTIIKSNIINEDKIISNKTSFRGILIDIWKTMPPNIILQNTSFNFKLEDARGDKGYYWCDDIKMSFQNKDAPSTLKEVIGMCKLNKYTMEITIKFKDGSIGEYVF